MRRLLVLLLLSARVWLCRLQADGVVRYSAVSHMMTWADAQSYCRARFTDLATIQDAASNAAARQAAGRDGNFWIGLFNTSWRWSLGNEDVSLNTSFTSWAPGEPGPGSCVTVSDSGLWSVRDCAVKYRCFCYSAAANAHILVQTPMSRSDAQVYCRSNYTDMSSIETAQANSQISSQLHQPVQPTVWWPVNGSDAVTSGSSSSSAAEAWVGLYRFVWGWSDRSSSTYTQWGPNEPSVSMKCVTMDTSAQWLSQPCNHSFSFLCYTNRTHSEVKTVQLRLSGGSADPNDPALQDSILQQLKQKLQDGGVGEVTLRWRRPPVGKVFHRVEQERAPPSGCDAMEDV